MEWFYNKDSLTGINDATYCASPSKRPDRRSLIKRSKNDPRRLNRIRVKDLNFINNVAEAIKKYTGKLKKQKTTIPRCVGRIALLVYRITNKKKSPWSSQECLVLIDGCVQTSGLFSQQSLKTSLH